MEAILYHSTMEASLIRGTRKDLFSRFFPTIIMICLVARISSGRPSAYAWAFTPFPPRSCYRLSRLFLSTESESIVESPLEVSHDIAVVGGGLAGLATAFHLLQKAPNSKITIFDKALPGCGGASSVAGGLLHPLSPKGKLVYSGLEGLAATNRLIDAACKVGGRDCILESEIYRVATNEDQVSILKDTANSLPSIAEWRSRQDLESYNFPKDVLGALRLHSGCMVVHMPSYLGGLWEAIQTIGRGPKTWICLESQPMDDSNDWHNLLSKFDTVVLSAGAGLFQDSIVTQKLPIQLVRGQSIEMKHSRNSNHAVLGGKYVSPLPDRDRVLIGATHEFSDIPLDPEQVIAELRQRTTSFASEIWENGTIDKLTCGYRVQSNRGRNGRMPIVGKVEISFHRNAWIYTGLSSRGLLYHGIFGEILASKILQTEYKDDGVNLNWWKS